METTFIYSLSDPITNEVKYIGQSKKLHRRLLTHIYDRRTRSHKEWTASLLLNGLIPKMEIVDEVLFSEWGFWEQHYISLFRSWGFELINKALGGAGYYGVHVPHTDETRKKMSNARMGFVSWEAVNTMKQNGTYERTKFRMLGETNPGKKHMRPVIQSDLSGNQIKEWPCASDAGNALNVDPSGITRAAQGKYKKSSGFIWKYKNSLN